MPGFAAVLSLGFAVWAGFLMAPWLSLWGTLAFALAVGAIAFLLCRMVIR